MNGETRRRRFVGALAAVAVDQVVAGEIAVLRRPPGRRPSLDLSTRSDWFLSLESDEQSLVADIVRSASYGALHRVLTALDGATSLSESGDEGRLQLLWRTDDDVIDLTDSIDGPDLHDLLAELRG